MLFDGQHMYESPGTGSGSWGFLVLLLSDVILMFILRYFAKQYGNIVAPRVEYTTYKNVVSLDPVKGKIAAAPNKAIVRLNVNYRR